MELENIINEQLSSMDLSQLQELLGAVQQNGSLFHGMGLGDVLSSLIRGETVFSWDEVLSGLASFFFAQVQSSLTLAVEVFAVCILIGMLESVSSSFSDNASSKLGVLVCTLIIVVLCVRDFLNIYNMCADSAALMVRTMQVLLPILVPLLIAMGGVTAGSILNPVIMGAITILSTVILSCIMPAVFISCVFLLVNSLSGKDYIKKLAKFLRAAAIFLMGLTVTVFSALTSIQGVISKSADGMLMKTAQFSIDNFIPIIGGFAADSVDLILSCTQMIKNGVGVVGLLIIVSLMLIPLIKLLASALIYKVLAIVLEPISGKRISDCVDDIGNSVITLSVILILTGILFFIFLAVLISVGRTV
ncbi:stage III sporulation protein AE [Bacilliculturomica massiliensis]|uniref:stage III sporulation protein AE n=1 Tax=Bacilliculturomica massiliensis TaxID=1917867 RepID=UPI001030B767|nr:stage III sporulation protein AE [Bacilliculturomica massiliensis]